MFFEIILEVKSENEITVFHKNKHFLPTTLQHKSGPYDVFHKGKC